MKKKKILSLETTLKAMDLVVSTQDFALLEEFCPNESAYQCDRRRQRIYEVKKTVWLWLNPLIDLRAGDRLAIVDGGNIAAGEEPEAWIIR